MGRTTPVQTDSVAKVHHTLGCHPNFAPPDSPATSDPEDVARYVIEYIARYISPPKIEGEDDELACIDLATAIRDRLGPEILGSL